MHITTVGFHKAKARMNPPANSHRKQKAFGEGENPQACSDGSECNVQHLYLYIYLYHIYRTTVRPKQMPDISFYTITEQRQTNFFFFF